MTEMHGMYVLQRNITPWFTELELRYGQSKIDHVMDTYSMRYLSMMGNQVKKAMNPNVKPIQGI